MDIFLTEDLKKLLRGKKVVFLGDSNVRSYYKDMLCLFTKSEIISQKILKDKMEKSLFGDTLLSTGERTNGRHYREERELRTGMYNFSFYFLTRVYNEYVEDVLDKCTRNGLPDVLIINSCLWDLARWGPKGVEQYKVNIVKLMKRLKEILTEKCLVIWVTAPPLAHKPFGGFLLVQLEFLKYCLRFHVMEANNYASKIVAAHGYDVVDIHYHLRMQLHRRAHDGIHWLPQSVRYITNLLLTHVALAWGNALPNRYIPPASEKEAASHDKQDNKENAEKRSMKEGPSAREVRPTSSTHAFAHRQRYAESRRRIRGWQKNA